MGKKKTTKVSVGEVAAGQAFGRVPTNQHFFLRDGRELRTLHELAIALQTMNEDTYGHHVGEHNNDFSNWVGDSLSDATLAESLQQAESQQEAELAVLRRITDRIHGQ